MKSGVIVVNKIYVTKNHFNCFLKLVEFSDNPFLPYRISHKLKKIVSDIHTNLSVHMKTVLIKFLKDFSEKYFKEKIHPEFSPDGIFNEFNHQGIHHEEDITILKNEIRDYLMIEAKW